MRGRRKMARPVQPMGPDEAGSGGGHKMLEAPGGLPPEVQGILDTLGGAPEEIGGRLSGFGRSLQGGQTTGDDFRDALTGGAGILGGGGLLRTLLGRLGKGRLAGPAVGLMALLALSQPEDFETLMGYVSEPENPLLSDPTKKYQGYLQKNELSKRNPLGRGLEHSKSGPLGRNNSFDGEDIARMEGKKSEASFSRARINQIRRDLRKRRKVASLTRHRLAKRLRALGLAS